jgi:hypothetical protein
MLKQEQIIAGEEVKREPWFWQRPVSMMPVMSLAT